VRRADITGRLGADEFAVLLTPSSSRGASIVAENILRAIANLQITRGPDNQMLSASIGVAVTLRGQVNEEDLVATAAHACDLAKKNGRNQYETLVADGRIQAQRQFRLLAV
jgi:diguanylate cyclase (GGDEF)-like protein